MIMAIYSFFVISTAAAQKSHVSVTEGCYQCQEIENNSRRSSHHKVCIMGINEHWIHQQNEANSPTTKDASLYPHFASSSFHSSLNVNASSSFYCKPSPDITSEYDSWFIQRNCFFLQLIFAKSGTLIVLGSANAEAHAVQKSPTFCRINS